MHFSEQHRKKIQSNYIKLEREACPTTTTTTTTTNAFLEDWLEVQEAAAVAPGFSWGRDDPVGEVGGVQRPCSVRRFPPCRPRRCPIPPFPCADMGGVSPPHTSLLTMSVGRRAV